MMMDDLGPTEDLMSSQNSNMQSRRLKDPTLILL